MARYEHLPIYSKAMELGIYLDTVVRNFSRYNKYTIGEELRNLSRNIIKLIIRADSLADKTESLFDLVQSYEMLKTMLFYAKETKAFANFNSFQHATGLAVLLCKPAWFINKHKGRTGVRRSQEGSQVWQREYWDRFISDDG